MCARVNDGGNSAPEQNNGLDVIGEINLGAIAIRHLVLDDILVTGAHTCAVWSMKLVKYTCHANYSIDFDAQSTSLNIISTAQHWIDENLSSHVSPNLGAMVLCCALDMCRRFLVILLKISRNFGTDHVHVQELQTPMTFRRCQELRADMCICRWLNLSYYAKKCFRLIGAILQAHKSMSVLLKSILLILDRFPGTESQSWTREGALHCFADLIFECRWSVDTCIRLLRLEM
jgi:hypothetical protein